MSRKRKSSKRRKTFTHRSHEVGFDYRKRSAKQRELSHADLRYSVRYTGIKSDRKYLSDVGKSISICVCSNSDGTCSCIRDTSLASHGETLYIVVRDERTVRYRIEKTAEVVGVKLRGNFTVLFPKTRNNAGWSVVPIPSELLQPLRKFVEIYDVVVSRRGYSGGTYQLRSRKYDKPSAKKMSRSNTDS